MGSKSPLLSTKCKSQIEYKIEIESVVNVCFLNICIETTSDKNPINLASIHFEHFFNKIHQINILSWLI